MAQLILERICMAPIVEVDSLDETERLVSGIFVMFRGAGGFGSTGIKKVKTSEV